MTREETALAIRLGGAIRSARKARGWSQEKLALKLASSTNHVGNMERGKGLPSVGMLATVSRLLEISIDDVFADRAESRPTVDPGIAALFEGIAPELRPMALRLLKDFARQNGRHQVSAATAARLPKRSPRRKA